MPVAEELQPLPINFDSGDDQSPREKGNWFGSLKRKRSLKGRDSVKHSGSLKANDSVKDPVRKREVRRVPVREKGSRDSSGSDSKIPGGGGVEGIQLATLAGGQFYPRQVSLSSIVFVSKLVNLQAWLSLLILYLWALLARSLYSVSNLDWNQLFGFEQT